MLSFVIKSEQEYLLSAYVYAYVCVCVCVGGGVICEHMLSDYISMSFYDNCTYHSLPVII